MKNSFGYYLTIYFKDYLPLVRGLSVNTIKSYRDTIILLLEFFQDQLNIKSEKIKIDDLTVSNIERFLSWLEQNKNSKVSSRNVRLASIITFIKFLQKKELSHFETLSDIVSIKRKKAPENTISYLSIEEIRILLSTPNKSSKKELRDLVILSLLYETACRVQELLSITINDIRIGNNPSILLHGKGQKNRLVPISKDLCEMLQIYFNTYVLVNGDEYIFRNRNNQKLTRQGVQYIIDKYVDKAQDKNKDLFYSKITPHIFRHSKAMHLLEAGVNLIYIRDFLGHVSVITTEIYAKTNPEIKRKEIIKHSEAISMHKYSNNDKATLESWLKDNI